MFKIFESIKGSYISHYVILPYFYGTVFCGKSLHGTKVTVKEQRACHNSLKKNKTHHEEGKNIYTEPKIP